jgi:acetylglutamate kinase
VDATFNCLTVDGDMSTNDAVFALANSAAANPKLHPESPDLPRFQAALDDLCRELTKAIAADGEGATKMLTIEVSGAENFELAREYARAVAGSSLVKAAVFGADPNWGRIMSAIGARAGTLKRKLDPGGCSIAIQDTPVFEAGRPLGFDPILLRARMREPQILVRARLGHGPGNATAYGCDLSYDYVKINADYSSLIVPTEGGGVAKDDRLVNYSPGFKVSLLVEVLSYIGRLKGQCCVVKYGGAAMVKESLKKSFCDDLSLLRSLGLKPVVVHGGGPEISRTLERLGHASEFVDGRRITNSADLKVVEMVLTGSINSELVTLLNRDGAHAVGVSGKDGALLRAEKLVADDGRDLGQVGRITEVNHAFLQMLLDQGYLPVVSPVGLGPNGETYNINADDAASAIASSLKADKLVYLTDVAGILERGELISELTAAQLEAKVHGGAIKGGMKAKAEAILQAVRGGVSRVLVVDGRMPHSVIGELFTDRGVGTLVTP